MRNRLSVCRLRAFTVIELMVAAGITVVLAGLMIMVVSNVLNGWNRSHGALTTEGTARLVLDQLETDFTNALARRDGAAWLAVTAQADNGVSGQWRDGVNAKPASLDATAIRPELARENQGQPSSARFGKAGVWLRLIVSRPTATAGTNIPAAPVAVSYQLVRRPPSDPAASGPAHYLLFRSEATPATTFTDGYDLTPGSSFSPAYLSTLQSPHSSDIIADNVVDFGVWFYRRDATGALVRLFPLGAAVAGRYPDGAGDHPLVADVMVRILTPEGVQQLGAYEAGELTGDWWEIVEAHSKVFVRRVRLPSVPL